jgi:radical SAM protein with 4Fe4S-binding SPASM domain
MTVVAGNIRENSFSEIWHTSPVLRQLRDTTQLKGRCGICEFNQLCGGCRCRAYAAYGDTLQEDPACTYQPTGRRLEFSQVLWSAEAWARMERIPLAFIREKVKQGLEAYAQRNAIGLITPEVMKAVMAGEGRPEMFKQMPSFWESKE